MCDGNRKEKCILRVIAKNKNKDHLSAVAKNLNTNNPCIVLENVKLVANAKNIIPEIPQQDICATNIDCTNKHININSLSNGIDFDKNAISFLNNGLGQDAINGECNDEHSGVKAANLNVTFICDKSKTCSETVDSGINANNSTNDIDFDNIFSSDNGYDHDARNGESNVNNPTRHADSDNSMIFSNDSDKHSRVKTVNLDVTFICDKGNTYETVNSDFNANNSTNGNDSNKNMAFSCDNDKDHSIIDNAINANNSTNGIDLENVIFPCDNGNGYKTVASDINTNNLTNGHDSYENVTFFDNGSANNSVTGAVLNDVMIFPFDINNNSNILDNVTNAKTSMNSNDGDNNTFPCDNDSTIDNNNNIPSVNTTNISEYLPSTEITVETEEIIETVEYEKIHNNISTNNDKNSSESLIDISFVNTFGCKEDNLCIAFSQPKELKKKNFCYYCKKFQSKIARHLENVHKLEPEVQKFLLLPKGNLERKKIIETIRKKGNFIHNTDPSVNTEEL